MMNRLARCGAVLTLIVLATLPGAGPAAARTAPVPSGCTYKPGTALTTQPWAQAQLNFQKLWSTTEGLSIKTGRPITIGVIDTGFNTSNPQLADVNRAPTVSFAAPGNDGNTTDDCFGHGTEVTSIIVAQPSTAPGQFVGVAPQARIVPIKFADGEATSSATPLVQALKYAVDQHVDIINISSGDTPKPTAPLIQQFQRVRRAGILVVVAGGNDNSDAPGTVSPVVYPAALSTRFPNMIAVSAIDRTGSTGTFSTTGSYIDVAAPGVGVDVAERGGGFKSVVGTSYAAPFVSGTAALMLAAHPGLTPEMIKARIEATADPPPLAVPDDSYGYGILDPVLAVTGTQDNTVSLPPSPRGAALAAPRPPKAVDRSAQHRALAIALVLLGLAALVVTGAATLRGNRASGRRTARLP